VTDRSRASPQADALRKVRLIRPSKDRLSQEYRKLNPDLRCSMIWPAVGFRFSELNSELFFNFFFILNLRKKKEKYIYWINISKHIFAFSIFKSDVFYYICTNSISQ